jgi:hypothetical protein
MTDAVNLSEFARLVGISQPQVSHHVAAGLPIDEHGLIDPEVGQAWLRDNLDPARREAAKAGSRVANGPGSAKRGGARVTGKLESVAALRGEKLAREGELLALELSRKRGEVIDKAEVERAIFARARIERDAWLGFATRATAALAAEAGVDPHCSFPIFDRLIRAHLRELAETPLGLEEISG